MPHSLQELARALVGSPPNRLSLYLLGNVPGFPPMIQTVHLLSIAAVMGSIVLINLRVLDQNGAGTESGVIAAIQKK